MSKNLNSLISEADELIEKRAAEGMSKTASKAGDEDVFKLAEQIRTPVDAPVEPDTNINTLTEKIASSLALVDTLLNIEPLLKLAEFEKKARESGKSDEQIQGFIEKTGAAKKIRSIRMLLPAALGGIGLVGGTAMGHRTGTATGYESALKDVNQVLMEESW